MLRIHGSTAVWLCLRAVIEMACTRGQAGCKGGLNPKTQGQEGPHSIVITATGDMYTFGTCHKGLLANLGSKDGAFGKPWDELAPFKVGSAIRNNIKNRPMSPFAVWPPPYTQAGPFVHGKQNTRLLSTSCTSYGRTSTTLPCHKVSDEHDLILTSATDNRRKV